MIDNNEFRTFLRDLYKKDPCGVLPNAIWKTDDKLNNLQCSYICIDSEFLNLVG